MTGDVVSLALGPLVAGRRLAPVFRVRLDGQMYRIENKHGTSTLGQWQIIGGSGQLAEAIEIMQQFNARELARHRLRLW